MSAKVAYCPTNTPQTTVYHQLINREYKCTDRLQEINNAFHGSVLINTYVTTFIEFIHN